MKTSLVSDGGPFCLAQEETTNSCKDFFQTSIGSASPLRLSGIDSLAVMTLCRQLRLAAPGHKCLRPMEVFQCSTVAELLDLVDSKEVLDVPAVVEANGDFGQARTIWFAPGQVDNTCKWLYGCRGLLDPECFRRAAARLLARHEGLRAEMEPGGVGGVEGRSLPYMQDVSIGWRQQKSLETSLTLLLLIFSCQPSIASTRKLCRYADSSFPTGCGSFASSALATFGGSSRR